MTRIVLAAERFGAGQGGIARVARLVAKVLAEEVAAGRCEAIGLSLGDTEAPADLTLPIVPCRGSRAAFVARLYREALRSTHTIYDFLGLARAHPRLGVFGSRFGPYLTFLHGIEIWENARADRLAAARGARTLLADSGHTRERAHRLHGGFDALPVCWLGTEDDQAPETNARKPNRPTALILGRLDETPWKGHHRLIDAWPRVTAAIPEARLVVVGAGPGLAAARTRAEASSARGSIELRGFVPEAEIETVWNEASALTLPSTEEGFGLVFVEAMRRGVPILTSTQDAGAEVGVDGETGFAVDLSRPDHLVERLVELLREPALAERMGINGQRRWREHFRFSAFRERFLPHLHAFLAEG